jgi:hypothetical protein
MSKPRSRKPLPGYPIEEPFRSREAIIDYLSDDRIICLICGRPFKAMTGHLGAVHEMTADEYKDMYNIPYSYGLARETTRKLLSQAQKDKFESDPKQLERLRKLVKDNAKARLSGLTKARPKRDFIIAEHTQRGVNLAGHETEFSDDQKAAFLAALDSGMTQDEAVASVGYSPSGMYGILRKDKAFKEAVHIAIEAQPFTVQARQQRLGKRFEDECRRLLDKGHSDHVIAEKLGVTAMSVNRRTKKMRASR